MLKAGISTFPIYILVTISMPRKISNVFNKKLGDFFGMIILIERNFHYLNGRMFVFQKKLVEWFFKTGQSSILTLGEKLI